jgi:hypothetical protein
MSKLNLSSVTLLGIDTVNSDRLLKAFKVCESYADFGSKKLITRTINECKTESGIEVINTDEVNSIGDYSFFVMKRLNDFVKTSHVLIIQYDGFILNPEAWTDEFLKYDYIGAPWWHRDNYNVGNGGFSLRSKKLLEVLQNDSHIDTKGPEDHLICRSYGSYLQQKGIKFAPESLAHTFSIEGALGRPFKPVKYGSIWTNEFGFHGFGKTDIRNWERFNEFKEESKESLATAFKKHWGWIKYWV